MSRCPNALNVKASVGQLCKASLSMEKPQGFGVKLVSNPQVVHLAKNAGFDNIFIDLEHSALSINDVSNLSSVALLAGITPFVRVPYQCGDGFTQRVMDAGAMGVIFPHISSAIIEESNTAASSVFVMLESQEAIDSVDEIAAVPGVDVLLIGSNDLAIGLGVPGGFQTDVFRNALLTVSGACKKHGKIMGLAGIYDQRDFHEWAIRTLGVRYLLCQQDSGLIAQGAVKSAANVPEVE
ncbi:hypothetical protein ACHAQA_006885 [Verticillium albo-atrum]